MADLIVGPPATGERFYDREELVRSIWERLDAGSILFVAPRRFGKTSAMLHLRDNPEPGYIPIYLDVEWLGSPTQFVVELTAEMVRQLPIFRKAFKRVKHLSGLLRGAVDELGVAKFKIKLRERIDKEWQDNGRALIELAGKIDGKVLLMLDELPLMTKRMLRGKDKDSVEPFLYWLRSFREGPDAMENMRFIIGGSIGVQHILTQAGATASMNDLQNVKIEPFLEDVARKMVNGLFRGQGQRAAEPVIEQVLQEVEVFVPFFLQMLVRATCDLARDRREEISPSLVSEAYRERLISVESRTYFEHFYSRLRDYYDVDDEQAAKAMLRGLALKGELSIQELRNIYMQTHSEPSDEGFSHLLGDLENDFYLRRQDSFYIFHTKILRDWWVRFYGFELAAD